MVKDCFKLPEFGGILKTARNIRFDLRHRCRRYISSLNCRVNNVRKSILTSKSYSGQTVAFSPKVNTTS